MALVQVDKEVVTSAVSSVILTGIDSDDVYLLVFKEFQPSTDTVVRRARVTKSGTAQVGADYDSCFQGLYSDTTFGTSNTPNNTDFSYGWGGTVAQEQCSGLMYLYNFNASGEYSYGMFDVVGLNQANNVRGMVGGFVHKVDSASDGIELRFHSGNVESGTFILYKVV